MNPFKVIADRIRRRRIERMRRFVMNELKEPHSAASQIVFQQASNMATGMMMRWLDDRRTRRCAFCPSTDQLKKVGNHFRCPAHEKLK